MLESAPHSQRFIEENQKRLATLTTKEGIIDFEGYRVAEVADEILSGTEGYLASSPAGSGVRAYAGTGAERRTRALPDRDVIVLMKGVEFIPQVDRHSFAAEISEGIAKRLGIENPVDCTITYFNGVPTVQKTIESLTGMYSSNYRWLYMFSPAAFGRGLEEQRDIVRKELEHFPIQKQLAIIRGFARLVVEGEKSAFYKAPYRFPEIAQAQLNDLFLRRQEMWTEQIQQALHLDVSL